MGSFELLLDSCDRVVHLLGTDEVADQWSAPSALAEWSVGGLAGHLARSAFNLERALDHPAPPSQPLASAVEYYAGSEKHDADSPVGRRIRELGDIDAGGARANWWRVLPVR